MSFITHPITPFVPSRAALERYQIDPIDVRLEANLAFDTALDKYNLATWADTCLFEPHESEDMLMHSLQDIVNEIYRNHPDQGLSCGPRKLHVNIDSAHTGEAWIFQFGMFGCTHVIAFGSLEDALEDAASTLLEVAPGQFSEPDYAEDVVARFATGGVNLDDRENARLDKLMNEAEQDHTYTESGWVLSHEWYCFPVSTLEDLYAYVRND